jgi:hypothetical protein
MKQLTPHQREKEKLPKNTPAGWAAIGIDGAASVKQKSS